MLSIAGVTKRFGDFVAVDALSLELPACCVLAVLGPNGAGKTTTIKMCAGLLRPDAGSIRIDGHDVVRDGVTARSALAYVPDEPFLYERLTGREFLEFVGRIHGLDRTTLARRAAAAIERFSLGDFLDQLAEGYSHGMRQRVVLAAALLVQPRLLIVDEPLVGLDPHHIRVVIDLLREHAELGGAVLMSTHTLDTVDKVADQVCVIDHGRLLASGSVAEVRGGRDLETRFFEITDTARLRALRQPGGTAAP